MWFILISHTGWWYTYPSETYEFVSWGMTFPTEWNVIKFHGSKPPIRYLFFMLCRMYGVWNSIDYSPWLPQLHHLAPFISLEIQRTFDMTNNRCSKKPNRWWLRLSLERPSELELGPLLRHPSPSPWICIPGTPTNFPIPRIFPK